MKTSPQARRISSCAMRSAPTCSPSYSNSILPVIEGSEATEAFQATKISIHLYVPDCDAVFAKAITAGGKSIYAVADMPYGERSGGVEDPSGNSWWIATQQVDMYPNN